MSRLHTASLLAVLALGGCDFNKMAANATAKVAEAGGPGINGFWDYEIVGAAMPGAILQSEALVSVSPDNEILLIGLSKTYVSYAYGWLQDEWEIADDAGDFAKADRLEQRIQLVYRRAADVALRAVFRHDDKGKLKGLLAEGKVEPVRAYLEKEFTDQDDVASLYWAGLAWGSTIANSNGNVSELALAPVARSLLERSVALDPMYNDVGGLGVLATVEAMFPELFGGNLEKSRALYEKALVLCKRRNHLITLGFARNYAVNKQNRELFLQLIHEILEAPDQGSDIRLSNKVARHRAERYLQKVDDWFDPALAKTESPPAEEPAVAGTH